MSRELKAFSQYFMKGMELGGKWAEKREAAAIAAERNRIMGQRNTAVDKRENIKLGLYGEQVRANAELARARAQAALNPKARGGGGGGAAPSSADADALRKEAAERGIISAPPAAPPPQQNITNNYGGDGNGSGGTEPDPTPPVEGGYDTLAKGGMVRRRPRPRRGKRYAEGGIVGGMTLEQAMSYADRSGPAADSPKQQPKQPDFSLMAKAMTQGGEKKDVRPTGPVGSGTGGSYTTADVPTLTKGTGLGYRAGGMVRGGRKPDPNVHREPLDTSQWDDTWTENDSGGRYAEGGAVQDLTEGYDYRAAEKERQTKETRTKAEQAIQTEQQGEDPYAPSKSKRSDAGGDFGSSFAAAYDGGSADGATGSGGDAAGGVSGSGGVGGSATGGAGGSAAAGTSGEAGSDGGGTYRRGGRVRRFQSGGRVMEAIDTGTSGPGSGYGYRAAPPARRY